MKGQIIRSNADGSTPVIVEPIQITEFKTSKKWAEEIELAKSEYESIRRKIAETTEKSGYSAGYEKGLESGKVSGTAIAREELEITEGQLVATLKMAIETLDRQILTYVRAADELIVDLVISICETILREKITEDRSRIMQIIQEAVSVISQTPNATLLLHPSDMAVVAQFQDKMGKITQEMPYLVVTESAAITPGSCRIETRKGIVNADFIAQLQTAREWLTHLIDPTTADVGVPDTADSSTEMA